MSLDVTVCRISIGWGVIISVFTNRRVQVGETERFFLGAVGGPYSMPTPVVSAVTPVGYPISWESNNDGDLEVTIEIPSCVRILHGETPTT